MVLYRICFLEKGKYVAVQLGKREFLGHLKKNLRPCPLFGMSPAILTRHNRPIPIYENSNLAPRLRVIEQKKLIVHPSSSIRFLLFYFPKSRSQVRILRHRNWPIVCL